MRPTMAAKQVFFNGSEGKKKAAEAASSSAVIAVFLCFYDYFRQGPHELGCGIYTLRCHGRQGCFGLGARKWLICSVD